MQIIRTLTMLALVTLMSGKCYSQSGYLGKKWSVYMTVGGMYDYKKNPAGYDTSRINKFNSQIDIFTDYVIRSNKTLGFSYKYTSGYFSMPIKGYSNQILRKGALRHKSSHYGLVYTVYFKKLAPVGPSIRMGVGYMPYVIEDETGLFYGDGKPEDELVKGWNLGFNFSFNDKYLINDRFYIISGFRIGLALGVTPFEDSESNDRFRKTSINDVKSVHHDRLFFNYLANLEIGGGILIK